MTKAFALKENESTYVNEIRKSLKLRLMGRRIVYSTPFVELLNWH